MSRIAAITGVCKTPAFGLRWCKSNLTHQEMFDGANGIPNPDDCAEAKTARHPTGYVTRGFKIKMRNLHLVPVYTGKSNVSTFYWEMLLTAVCKTVVHYNMLGGCTVGFDSLISHHPAQSQ